MPNTIQQTTSVRMMLRRGSISSLSRSSRVRVVRPKITAAASTISPVIQSANTKLSASNVGVNVPEVWMPMMLRNTHVTRAPSGIIRIRDNTRCISRGSRVRSRMSTGCRTRLSIPCGAPGNCTIRNSDSISEAPLARRICVAPRRTGRKLGGNSREKPLLGS